MLTLQQITVVYLLSLLVVVIYLYIYYVGRDVSWAVISKCIVSVIETDV
jgi:hypothetical protein